MINRIGFGAVSTYAVNRWIV